MYRIDNLTDYFDLKARHHWLAGCIADLRRHLGRFDRLPQECKVTFSDTSIAHFTRNDVLGLNRELKVRTAQLREFKLTGELRGSLKRALAKIAA